MNPVTLRRLLVFGVCAVGVVALYLAPDLTARSGGVAAPAPDDEPTSLPTGTATTALSPTSRSTPRVPSTRTAGGETSTTSPAPPAPRSTATSRVTRSASSGATAYDPRPGTDHVAPAPVADITTSDVTLDRLTVSWPAATDDVGVLRYRVVLNGFTVATTSQTHATVRWFNDDVDAHVVQVRALDAAGNESPTSPNLLVSRPSPSASATPSASTSPTPAPSSPTPAPSTPARSATPSMSPTPDGGERPSATPALATSSAGAR